MTQAQILEARQKLGIPTQGIGSVSGSGTLTPAQSRQKRLESFRQSKEETEQEGEGFIEGTKSALSKRGQALKETAIDTMEGRINPLETGIQTVGQVLGGVGDIAGQAFKAVTPDFLVEKVTEGLKETPVGKMVSSVAPKAVEKYQSFKEENPRAAKNIESVVNIATALPIGQGAKVTKTLGKEAMSSVKSGIKSTAQGFSDNVLAKAGGVSAKTTDEFIDKSLAKSIKPSVAGKKSLPQQSAYNAKNREAVKEIVNNKDILDLDPELPGVQLPETLAQTQKAVAQTKANIFNQYSAMAKKAGEREVEVSLNPISKELQTFADNKVLRDMNPQIADYALTKAQALAKRGVYTPQEAQEAVKILNESLEAFYRNPSYDSASRAMVDAMVANNLRKGLDSAIESAGQSGYQVLKNKYGALSQLEKDVTRMAIMEGRKNAKGLLDFTDIFSGGQMMTGLVSLNPSLVASGAFQTGIKNLFKTLNSPDAILRRMFRRLDKEGITTTAVETPKSQKLLGFDPNFSNTLEVPAPTTFEAPASKIGTATDNIIYRGGGNINEEKITNSGISFSSARKVADDFAKEKGGDVYEYILSPKAKIVEYSSIPDVKFKYLNDYSPELDVGNRQIWRDLEVEYQKAVDWAKKNGYDAVKLPLEGEIRVINPSVIERKWRN